MAGKKKCKIAWLLHLVGVSGRCLMMSELWEFIYIACLINRAGCYLQSPYHSWYYQIKLFSPKSVLNSIKW